MSMAQQRARMRSGRARAGARRRGRGPGSTGIGGQLVSAGRRAFGGRAGLRGRARRRGITGTELRGFNRVSRLLGKFGMVPRRLRGARLVRAKR